MAESPRTTPVCAHCGLRCPDDRIVLGEKFFCCHGCKTVYQILSDSGLGRFYQLETAPGVRPSERTKEDDRFAYLEDAAIQDRLLDYRSETVARVTLRVPAIHCVACVWLLENLFRLNPAIGQAQVNFPRKEVALSFDPRRLSLRGLVELLASLGYEPVLNLGEGRPDRSRLKEERSLWLKIGLAGFAFGNVMLLSMPSYLGLQAGDALRPFFGWISFGLSIPVLAYSAADYFRHAWHGLRQRALTIEFPLAIGLTALFAQSAWEVATHTGEGYFDSFTGLVFFLLAGRWFQQHSYAALAFDRDYRSYFPLSVRRREPAGDRPVPVTALKAGDRIVVRHQEIVPADSRLLSPEARLDFSFVTGESEPVIRRAGETVHAGGRLTGPAVELETLKETSQSYLASLWNHEAFRKQRDRSLDTTTNRASRWFTAIVLLLAAGAAAFWAFTDSTRAVRAAVATLIVACPCALALAAPFALGAAQRVLGRHRFFLKEAATVEHLAHIDAVVFDKTGTLTRAGHLSFEGPALDPEAARAVRAVAAHSTHPLSRGIAGTADEAWPAVVQFEEAPGAGVAGTAGGHRILLGSAAWLRTHGTSDLPNDVGSGALIALNGRYAGRFHAATAWRTQLEELGHHLATHYALAVLSGDSDREEPRLRKAFGDHAELRFSLQPAGKLEAIASRQQRGERVLMLGDGLNDAGALRQAEVGVAVTDDIAAFSPACDAILDANRLGQLPDYLRFTRATLRVIHLCFAASVLYNAVGLGFALTGRLSPLVSAILMPVSSVSVVAFALLAVRGQARRIGVTTA